MWKPLLLCHLLIGASWQMRLKRSEDPDGCEWWDKSCQEDAEANLATTTPSTTASYPPTTTAKGSTAAQMGCTCVPYFQCKGDAVNQDGDHIIDVRRAGRQSATAADNPCDNPLEICCRSPERSAYVPSCGLRRSAGVNDRFLPAKDTDRALFGEFPWMALLLRSDQAEEDFAEAFLCGGSLIHPQVVLTSAHCVANEVPETLKVRLGEWDTSSDSEWLPHTELSVQDVLIHDDYSAATAVHDVALVFLSKAASLAPYVDTICLAQSLESVNGSSCVVTGWGHDHFDHEEVHQSILKKVAVPLVERALCQNVLRSTRLGPYFKLHASFICAGGTRGRDACLGDGGSPLACPLLEAPDRYVQVGVVSWGIGCGDAIPAAYASVVQAADWIRDSVGQRVALTDDWSKQ